MSSAKLVLVSVLAAVLLSACGIAAKPVVDSPGAQIKAQNGIDDPRTAHIACLAQDHIPVTPFGRVWLQIGAKPSGPTVQFTPTPGIAQGAQISGRVESAEVIGSALLYPNQASDGLLAQVEACMAQGVKG
jgi:hypothetical protein